MMKKRDGIAEILKSGRFPGFSVRGSSHGDLDVPHVPFISGGSPNPRKKRQDDARTWEEKRRIAKEIEGRSRPGRKRDGAIRHIGCVPDMQVETSLRRKYGDHYKGAEKKKILKDHGFLWDD